MRHVVGADVPGQVRPNGRVAHELLNVAPDDGTRVAVLLAYHHAGFVEDVHVHRHMWELLYFLDPAVYRVGDRAVSLNSGDLLVIEPGEPHGALPVPHPVRIHVTQVPKVAGDKHPWPG